MKIYINGEYFNKEDAKISVYDHGLLYGDGVFEGIRLYEKCVFKLDEHLKRLEHSAKAIMLKMPWSREEIAELVLETCRKNNLVNGYIRLVVTRGPGSLGISTKTCTNPQLIIIADTITMYSEEAYANGLKIVTVPTRRMNSAALSPHIKSLNYLNNVMAKMEAERSGCDEAIMLNDQGYIAECSADNLFTVVGDTVFTPHSSDGALKGVTRETVKALTLELGFKLRVENMTRYDVWTADECFLTGTAAEIIAVAEADGRVIGTGKRGPVTAKLLEAFRKTVTKVGRML